MNSLTNTTSNSRSVPLIDVSQRVAQASSLGARVARAVVNFFSSMLSAITGCFRSSQIKETETIFFGAGPRINKLIEESGELKKDIVFLRSEIEVIEGLVDNLRFDQETLKGKITLEYNSFIMRPDEKNPPPPNKECIKNLKNEIKNLENHIEQIEKINKNDIITSKRQIRLKKERLKLIEDFLGKGLSLSRCLIEDKREGGKDIQEEFEQEWKSDHDDSEISDSMKNSIASLKGLNNEKIQRAVISSIRFALTPKNEDSVLYTVDKFDIKVERNRVVLKTEGFNEDKQERAKGVMYFPIGIKPYSNNSSLINGVDCINVTKEISPIKNKSSSSS